MELWQNIYSHFNPVAFQLFGIPVHWYGIMYLFALGVGFWVALHFAPQLGLKREIVEEYFIWVEIGIILGARIGYFLFYVPNNSYYFLHPWEIFNPFDNGRFVGIRGMSYHGALIGGVLATLLYKKFRPEVDLWRLGDLAGLAIPIGYIFGRIGNFLNQELYGRPTSLPWGIYVDGTLRHPSQLYEAFLEGALLFGALYYYFKRFYRHPGELIGLYLLGYSGARFIAEFWRAPDPQLGFLWFGLTMGQWLSIGTGIGGFLLWYYKRRSK
ncbi:MAG: prolipoprotein diacylglyceryl transferase [Campylobacterales bacterium]